MKTRLKISVCALLGIAALHAQDFIDLGYHGSVYEIKEGHMVKQMTANMKDYNETKALEEAEQNAADSLVADNGMPRCQNTNKRSFSPTVVLDNDIVEPVSKEVLQEKGKVNILRHIEKTAGVAFKKYILFIDASDKQHRVLAKRYRDHADIVVTEGNVRNVDGAMMADEKLIEMFDLKCIPSFYEQKGDSFEISEYNTKDIFQ